MLDLRQKSVVRKRATGPSKLGYAPEFWSTSSVYITDRGGSSRSIATGASFEIGKYRIAAGADSIGPIFFSPPYDAMAAKRARVGIIGMLSGGFSRADLEASGCAAVYRDPTDLLAHYNEAVRLRA